MVWRFGMGKSGFVGDFSVLPKEHVSEALKQKLNDETQAILHQALTEAEATLKAEWKIVERFVAELLAHDELDYDDIARIFAEFGKQSPKPEYAPVPPPPAA